MKKTPKWWVEKSLFYYEPSDFWQFNKFWNPDLFGEGRIGYPLEYESGTSI